MIMNLFIRLVSSVGILMYMVGVAKRTSRDRSLRVHIDRCPGAACRDEQVDGCRMGYLHMEFAVQ